MDVYEREGKPDDIPKGAKYMGCFADDNQDRALTLKNDSNSKMNYSVRMEDVSILLGQIFPKNKIGVLYWDLPTTTLGNLQ